MQKRQPALRLVFSRESDSSGYKSGRSTWRDTPVIDSTASTRSPGMRPKRSQVEMDPCDFIPNARAKAVCPPAALQASKTTSLVMEKINAQFVNRVNAVSGNHVSENARMPKRAELPGSDFWIRLAGSLPQDWAPVNPNSVAMRLEMSQGSVYRWYTGTGLPELKTALMLAKECGVCVDWLLNAVKPKYPISNDPVLRELFEICENLESDSRKYVLRAARNEAKQQEESEPTTQHRRAGQL